MDHSLPFFYSKRKKLRKSINKKFELFCEVHNRIPFFLALRLSVRRFQIVLEGLTFARALVTFGIINATDSLTQNIIRIVCLRWFIFDILKLWRPYADLRAPIFQNQTSFPHALSLKRGMSPHPNIFCFWNKQFILLKYGHGMPT